MPRTFIWNNPTADEYPSVWVFAMHMKHPVMSAHNPILESHVKQTRDANQPRHASPCTNGDLVYLSTVDLALPKGLMRKLSPKYIGPYKIVPDCSNNSYRLDLPDHMRQRGIHPVFHASLLRIHIQNDDQLFLGYSGAQVADFGEDEPEPEWCVDRILSPSGSGRPAVFEIHWTSGDVTWLPYDQVGHLSAITDYLELQQVSQIQDLPRGAGTPPEADVQIYSAACSFDLDNPIPERTTMGSYASVRRRPPELSEHLPKGIGLHLQRTSTQQTGCSSLRPPSAGTEGEDEERGSWLARLSGTN